MRMSESSLDLLAQLPGHTPAAGALGMVHTPVGGFQQHFSSVPIDRKIGNTSAECNSQGRFARDLHGADIIEQMLYQHRAARFVDSMQEQNELVASKPEQQVGCA